MFFYFTFLSYRYHLGTRSATIVSSLLYTSPKNINVIGATTNLMTGGSPITMIYDRWQPYNYDIQPLKLKQSLFIVVNFNLKNM